MSVEVLTMPSTRRYLQRLYRTKSYPSGRYGKKETPPEDKEEGEWCLQGPGGGIHTLPKTMIFLGREECDIEVQVTDDEEMFVTMSYGGLSHLCVGRRGSHFSTDCQTDSVDKRHAVITFDHYLRRFKIKDLSTTCGTYVNNTRIPEQEYVTLEKNDRLILGDDDILSGAVLLNRLY